MLILGYETPLAFRPMAIIKVELETIWLLTMVFGGVQLTSHGNEVCVVEVMWLKRY